MRIRNVLTFCLSAFLLIGAYAGFAQAAKENPDAAGMQGQQNGLGIYGFFINQTLSEAIQNAIDNKYNINVGSRKIFNQLESLKQGKDAPFELKEMPPSALKDLANLDGLKEILTEEILKAAGVNMAPAEFREAFQSAFKLLAENGNINEPLPWEVLACIFQRQGRPTMLSLFLFLAKDEDFGSARMMMLIPDPESDKGKRMVTVLTERYGAPTPVPVKETKEGKAAFWQKGNAIGLVVSDNRQAGVFFMDPALMAKFADEMTREGM